MSGLRRDAIALLSAWPPPDGDQARLRQYYLRHLNSYADGLSRTRLPEHLTASALVISTDGERVLLHLHRKVGRWLQFGGHCEPEDSTLALTAYRETLEESGLEAVELDETPVQLSRHEVLCGGQRAYHLDVQFVAVAAADGVPTKSAESEDVKWYPARSLPPDADDAVVDLVARSRERLR